MIMCRKLYFTTESRDEMAKMITKKHINMTARPRLAKVMEKANCYLLEGELAKNKRQDAGALKVLADYTFYCEIIIDEASYMGEPEFFKSIRLDKVAMYALADLFAEKQKPPKRKESTGRPVKNKPAVFIWQQGNDTSLLTGLSLTIPSFSHGNQIRYLWD